MRRISLLPLILAFCVVPSGCGGKNGDEPQAGGAKAESAAPKAGEQPRGGQSGGGRKTQTAGYESPQAAFEGLQAAFQQKDWKTVAASLTPESQEQMAGMLMFMGGLIVAFDEEKRPALLDLFKKHGIDEDALKGEGDSPFASPDEPPAKKIPEKLETKLSLSYEKPFGVFAPTGKKPLFATLELTGRPAVEATAYGHLQVESARDDAGKDLELLKSPFSGKDASQDYVAIDRGFGPEDEQKTRIHLMLDRPDAKAGKLAVLEGSLKLLTGGETKEVTIPRILDQKPGEPIENEDLDDAGVTVKRSRGFEKQKNADRKVAVEIAGSEAAVKDVTLVDAQGKDIQFGSSWFGSGEGTTYSLESGDKLPDDAGVKLTLVVGQKPVDVPLNAENVPLPPPEGKGDRRPDEGPAGGFGGPPDVSELAAPLKDKPAFIADMLVWIEKNADDEDEGPDFPVEGELTELKIEGETARGTIVSKKDGETEREPIDFRKVNGRWFVQLPGEMAAITPGPQ